MPQLEETEFTAWNFTPEELLEACVFTDMQKKYIQTEITRWAQQQISATAENITSPEEFIRAHEYRRGLIGGLRYLLEMSNASEQARNALIEKRVSLQAADIPNFDPNTKG